jgi:hypothetical protein
MTLRAVGGGQKRWSSASEIMVLPNTRLVRSLPLRSSRQTVLSDTPRRPAEPRMV